LGVKKSVKNFKDLKMNAIDLFNEKYKKLESSRFVKYLKNYGFNPKVNVPEERHLEDSIIPDNDSIDAFVLTIRFFIQNNEPCSIYNLSIIYNNRDRVSNEYRDQFNNLRKILNDTLDSQLWFSINTTRLTYRQVLEGMIFSELSHSNKNLHEDFSQNFKKTFLSTAILKHEFIRILMFLYASISEIYELNEVVFNR
jgi:hypothetical protein